MANFRFTKWKIITFILITIIWYALLFFFFGVLSQCYCSICLGPAPGVKYACVPVSAFRLIPEGCNCGCGCTVFDTFLTIKTILLQLFFILLPGLLIYLTWSFIQKKEIIKQINKQKGGKK